MSYNSVVVLRNPYWWFATEYHQLMLGWSGAWRVFATGYKSEIVMYNSPGFRSGTNRSILQAPGTIVWELLSGTQPLAYPIVSTLSLRFLLVQQFGWLSVWDDICNITQHKLWWCILGSERSVLIVFFQGFKDDHPQLTFMSQHFKWSSHFIPPSTVNSLILGSLGLERRWSLGSFDSSAGKIGLILGIRPQEFI